MSSHGVKIAIASLLAAVAAATVVGAVAVLAGGISFFRSGADPADALRKTTVTPAGIRVTWLDDSTDLVRPMEDTTRAAITAAYLAAWDHRTDGGDGHYATGPAAAAMSAGPEPRVVEADRAHRLQLVFYSADGQLVALSDTATIARSVALDHGRWEDAAAETYTIVMVFVDGNWRLRHSIRDSL